MLLGPQNLKYLLSGAFQQKFSLMTRGLKDPMPTVRIPFGNPYQPLGIDSRTPGGFWVTSLKFTHSSAGQHADKAEGS